MPDERKFSRKRHRIKLNRREEIESELRSEVTLLLKGAAPSVPPAAINVVARLVSEVASQLLSQTQVVQRSLAGLHDDTPDYAAAFVEDLIREAGRGVRLGARKIRAAEVLPLTDSPVAPDWAGPVAGPTVIERHFGIPRSTLYRWQKRNEVVWLNTRTSRKPVFPLMQFVDGRPEEGVAEVVQAFGEPRAAWQWLLSSSPEHGQRWLDGLLEKRKAMVVAAALEQAGRRPHDDTDRRHEATDGSA